MGTQSSSRRLSGRGAFVANLAGLPFVVAVAVVLGTGGAASAFFHTTGNGAGSGAAGTLRITVSAVVGGDTPGSTLYPGGPAADVVLRLDNPNPFAVVVSGISGTGPAVADVAHSTCTTTGVVFTPPVNPAITVPQGSSLVDLPGAATMTTASVSGCQGATFSIPVSVTVRR